MVKNFFLVLLSIAVIALISINLYEKHNKQIVDIIAENKNVVFYGEHIDASIIKFEGVIYVPLQIISKIGYKMVWDDETGTVATITADEDITEQILKLVNEERKKRGIAALILSDELTKAAQTKAKDMIDNNYFDHHSPTYGGLVEMLEHFGIEFDIAGENIARGHKTARDVMKAWMDSDNHRKNILFDSYGEIGAGYENGVWVQLFK